MHLGFWENDRMPGRISDEAAKLAVEGLKEAGVDFVAVLPDLQHTSIQRMVQADEAFKYFHVSEEGLGFATCAGAWLGGKKPALVITTAGLLNACWAISAFQNFDVPVLILIPHRGVLGDTTWFMRKYIHKIEPFLQMFEVPFEVVKKLDEVKPSIMRAQKTASHLYVPVAILFSGDTMW